MRRGWGGEIDEDSPCNGVSRGNNLYENTTDKEKGLWCQDMENERMSCFRDNITEG